MEDFERRVSKNGSVSEDLTKKISAVETRLASADASLDDNSSNLASSNLVKIEQLSTQLEELKLDLAQLKLNKGQAQTNCNSTEMNKWFETKFHAFLEAPKARLNINDMIDTKVHTHKVKHK